MRMSLLLAVAFSLSACGEVVEVPPAHIGKVLTRSGYKPDNVPPSKFRLEPCMAYCDRLILLELADKGMEEEFQLFMPRDQLNVSFDLRFTVAVRDDPVEIDRIFDRVPAKLAESEYGRRWEIDVDRLYETYGRPVIREVVRTIMARFTINEVASSREEVNAEITRAVIAELAATH